MPPAIVTPSELRVFARYLEDSSRSIAARKSKVDRLVADARSVWKDDKYDRFRKVFDQTVRDIDRFARLADDYSQFLQDKAILGQKYLNNR
jgi:uncharacterized protein YukE